MSKELSKCRDSELGALLHGYELGTLSEADAVRFEEHLVACEFCAAQLDAMLSLQEYREEIVADLRQTGDSFEAQFQRLKARHTRPSGFVLFLKSAYTRYVLAPAVAVAILTFFVVRDKAPQYQQSPEIITDLPSSHSAFKLSEPPRDTASAAPQAPTEVPQSSKEQTSVKVLPKVERDIRAAKPQIMSEPEQMLSVKPPDVEASAEVVINEESAAQEMRALSAPAGDAQPEKGALDQIAPQGEFMSKSAARARTDSGTPPAFRTTRADLIRISMQRAKVQFESGAYKNSLEYLEQALLETPNSGDVNFYWGVATYLFAQNKAALVAGDSALALAETQLAATDTLRQWANWYRAVMAHELGNNDAAYKRVKQHESFTPTLQPRARELYIKLLKLSEPTK